MTKTPRLGKRERLQAKETAQNRDKMLADQATAKDLEPSQPPRKMPRPGKRERLQAKKAAQRPIFVSVVCISVEFQYTPSWYGYLLPPKKPSGPESTLQTWANKLYSTESFLQTSFDFFHRSLVGIAWMPSENGVNVGKLSDAAAEIVANNTDMLEHFLLFYCGGKIIDKQPDLHCKMVTIYNVQQ